ncbi:Sodium/glucose cotransporter 4-like 1, partial [Homarus americanus]
VSTLPEYTRKRFGGRRIQMYLAVLSLILYIFTKISVNLFSGAIFIQQALKVSNLYVCIIFMLVLTAVCTMVGGLAAVIYTDTLQFFVMIGGSLFVVIKGFQEVGGYNELQVKYLTAIPEILVENKTCGLPRVDSWRMLRDADPTISDLPWPAFLLGQIPASLWYWCTDQMMVQRAMAAKSLSHAQGGTLFAGYFKILPMFIIILPGMISRVLFPNEVGCADPEECFKSCGSRVSCSNSAYPRLVLEYLPTGMRGVMLSVMLSAIMSNLTSIFNSASTLFTMDIWSYYRPKAKSREQLLVGRLFIVVLVGISILWIPIIEQSQGGQLFVYIQGAFWGLMIGFVIGMVRMALDFYYHEPACYEDDDRPLFIKN